MPTVYTRTVGATGRNYSTLQAAVDAIPTIATSADLVANDEQVVFELYNDADFTERVTIDESLTCDATRNVIIRAASGEEHSGSLGTGVTIAPTTGTGTLLTVLDDHVQIEGIAFEMPSTTVSGDICIEIGDGTSTVDGVALKKCLVWQGSAAIFVSTGVRTYENCGSSSTPILIENCVLWGFWDAAIAVRGAVFSGTNTIYCDVINCSFYDCFRAVLAQAASANTTTTIRMVNNLALATLGGGGVNYGTATTNGTIVTTGSTNNHGDLTGAGAFPGDVGTAYTETTSTTPGAGDWAIITANSGADFSGLDMTLVDDADNDVLDGGVGPSSNALVPSEDFVDNARAGTTCDPGASQITAAASPLEPTGIAPTGALGAPTVDGAVEPTGVASTAALGSPTVGASSIEPTGVASTTAYGAPVLAGELRPTGLASTAVVGVVAVALASLSPVGIASTAAVGSPGVGENTLAVDGIANVVALGVPTVGASIAPTGIASSSAVGAPAQTGEVRPTGLASTSVVGEPVLPSLPDITPGGIASTEAVGVPYVRNIPADAPTAYWPNPPARPNTETITSVSGVSITAVSDTIYNLTGNIGTITFNPGVARVEVRGNGFTCDGISINSGFITEVYAEDVWIEDLELVSSGIIASAGAQRFHFKEVVTTPANVTGPSFFGAGDAGASGLRDLYFEDCSLRCGSVPNSNFRYGTGDRLMIVGGVYGHETGNFCIRAQNVCNYLWVSDLINESDFTVGREGTPDLDEITITRTSCQQPYPLPDEQWVTVLGQPDVTNFTFTNNEGPSSAQGQADLNLLLSQAAGEPTWDVSGNTAFPGFDIGAVGIPSTAVVGAPQVDGEARPAGIASTEAVGSPTVAAVLIFPDGIASTSAVGAITTAATIFPTGFANLSVLGSPIVVDASGIFPDAIASTSAVGSPVLIGTIWDIQVPTTPIAGSYGELLKQTWLAATYTARTRILINGEPSGGPETISGGSP